MSLVHFIIRLLAIMSTVYYYEPKSTRINVQSPQVQSESTPRRLHAFSYQEMREDSTFSFNTKIRNYRVKIR